MHRQILWTAALVCASVGTAAAQQTPAAKPADKVAVVKSASGTWNGKSMIGLKDSVVANYSLTIAADGKSATMKFLDREPIAARILALGGDSVVTEAGPYPSVLRPGETVNTLRTTGHYNGDKMWGTFVATYAKGEIVKGKTEATRSL